MQAIAEAGQLEVWFVAAASDDELGIVVHRDLATWADLGIDVADVQFRTSATFDHNRGEVVTVFAAALIGIRHARVQEE